MRVLPTNLRRRLKAGLLAVGTLWVVSVTAGSDTAASAVQALWTAFPLNALRWELGDLWVQDDLSPATVMTIQQPPLLLSARPAVAELWKEAETTETPESEEDTVTVPVEETPLDADAVTDNGVPAKTLVPTDPSGYTVLGRTYISNSTDHTLSIQDLQQPFAAELTDEEPQILILHSHGSEAYTPADGTEVVWSGDHRTSIRFILDIHRDAIEDEQGNQYKVVTSIGDSETAAQMTLVVGSDGSGLTHPDWMENLRLAVAIQEQALSGYPTLMRPILLRNSRYNQHATTGSLLVEVGAAGNSPEEAAVAGRIFAEQMVEVLQTRSK